jgi:hypothetical protein
MLFNRDFSTKLVHNTSVLCMKFDNSMYNVNTVSAEETDLGDSLKVPNSEIGSAVC